MTRELDENLLALTKARRIPYRRRRTPVNEFPDTETRQLNERFARAPLADLNQIEAAIRHPLLAEREHTHGDFNATAMIAQRFKDISKSTPNWNGNLTDVQRESLEAIFSKIARLLSGDPNHPDTWSDIEGYAHLVRETLA